MKFFAYIALVGTASAMRLTHHESALAHHSFNQNHQIRHVLAQLKEIPSSDQFEAALKEKFEKDGYVTKDEAEAKLKQWEKETGKKITNDEWEVLEAGFDMVDLNDDGKLTVAEVECVMDGKGCPKPEAGDTLKLHEINEDQWKEIEKYLTEALGDGKLTKKEVKDGLKAFEEAYKVKIDKDVKKFFKEMFQLADADNNGEVSIAELEAMAEKYE